jgi:SAM-dependent methyltransferase
MSPRPGETAAGWSWDPSLYAGSAAYYATGRAAYPPELIAALAAELGLNGSGLLVDIGCGPGSLTLPLAPHFARVIGVDADADMLAEAARIARNAGVENAEWRHARAEDLRPEEFGPVRTVTLAQSFHWMDRPRVAALAHAMLAHDGALVHVHATTHMGVEGDAALAHPRPPWEAIADLVRRHLGPVRRAGRGFLPTGTAGGDEETVYRAAGFSDVTRVTAPGRIIERSADDIVAAVLSLSSSAPHLFGDGLPAFTAALRTLLAETSPGGVFAEEMRPVDADVWRKPR